MITERGRRRCKCQPRKMTRYRIAVGQLHGVATMTKHGASRGKKINFGLTPAEPALLTGSLLELENYSALPVDSALSGGNAR